MGRLAALLVAAAILAPAQPAAVLAIAVTVTAKDGSARPVPRHALLISDDPVTAAPQRVVTRGDGTVTVPLRPGRYTIESDAPFVFEGRSYQWAQGATVAPGGETRLALTSATATVESAGGAGNEASAEAALLEWQDSVFSIWTPTALGAGFLADARGLVVTSQRLIGSATAVEVQVSPTRKVAGRVVARDANANVAIVRIDPRAVSPATPMKPASAPAGRAPTSERDRVYAFDVRPGEPKTLVSGTVERVTTHAIATDVPLQRVSGGGPLLNAAGDVVAITTMDDDASGVNAVSPRAVRIEDARAAMTTAEQGLPGGAPPGGTLLPVESTRPFPPDALAAAARARGGNASAYRLATADFDVAGITPPILYASIHTDRGRRGRNPPAMPPGQRALDDFGNWSDYVGDVPPVILIRVTPKLTEGFWTTVARGAAQTQGVSIPPIKRPAAAFASMRLMCGDAEVPPIHALRIEHRLDAGAGIDEGLYVFEPSAIGPQCGVVAVTLFSEKAPARGDTRVVDAAIVRQVWDDFAPCRAAAK